MSNYCKRHKIRLVFSVPFATRASEQRTLSHAKAGGGSLGPEREVEASGGNLFLGDEGHNAGLASMMKNPSNRPPSSGIRSPLSQVTVSKKETHPGPGSATAHTADLRQVGLTVLDSHGWHKLGRLTMNRRLLPGQKAVISEGQISL